MWNFNFAAADTNKMQQKGDRSLMSSIGRGFVASATGGACLLGLLALPPVASRLVRFKLPNMWAFYAPIMFAKPVSAGVVAATPFVAWSFYMEEKKKT